jgi:hypothetical protein
MIDVVCCDAEPEIDTGYLAGLYCVGDANYSGRRDLWKSSTLSG